MRILRLLVPLVGGLSLACAQAQQHPFSVRDDIAMWRFSSPHPEPNDPESSIVQPSPDGHYAAIVATRGILQSDLIQSQIWVFDLNEVAAFLHRPNRSQVKPRIIATVESYPRHVETEAYAPVIKDLRWSGDGQRLFFRAENMKGNYQLCTVRIHSSKVGYLTPASETVDHFDVIGNEVLFSAGDPKVHLVDPGRAINRDAMDITGARVQEILFPDEVAAHAGALYRLYVLDLDKAGYPIRAVPRYSLLNIPFLSAIYPFETSPNGRSVVDLEPVQSIPGSWTRYATAPGAEHLRLAATQDQRLFRADNILRPLEYTLIDLTTGHETSLLRAPNARSLGFTADRNQVAWSQDGRQVIVTNTFLPSDLEQGPSNDLIPCAAAVVDVASLKARCLYFEDGTRQSESPRLRDVGFDSKAKEIKIVLRRAGGEQFVRTYTLEAGQWTLSSTTSSEARLRRTADPAPATIFVHQTLNDPPTLWATDHTGEQRELWDPNPQLRSMSFGEASPYTWKDKAAHDWSGILVKPLGYRTGVRYPLVIQLYSYNDGQFLTDGLYPTAFAARELADAGFVVLQVKKQPDTLTDNDPQLHLEAYSSAIDTLSDAGLIDRRKVGVVGFSLSCWYVVNALIKRPDLFAAATIADGIDYSYMQYMLFAVEFYPLQKQMDHVRGRSPLGAGLRDWLDVAPGFNLDRVKTPVRIEAIGPSSVLQEWELYSSLRLQGKPVDLIYFPEGTHIHQRPLERLESQQGDVDWFRFWLRDEEDRDVLKRPQHERWEAMRAAGSHEASLEQTVSHRFVPSLAPADAPN